MLILYLDLLLGHTIRFVWIKPIAYPHDLFLLGCEVTNHLIFFFLLKSL